MARTIVVNGVVIDMTPEEEAAWDAEFASAPTHNYKEQRQLEYPPIGDQLDALFKAGVFPADMAATLQAVKDKYPKE
jgi:hypothetical protein